MHVETKMSGEFTMSSDSKEEIVYSPQLEKNIYRKTVKVAKDSELVQGEYRRFVWLKIYERESESDEWTLVVENPVGVANEEI